MPSSLLSPQIVRKLLGPSEDDDQEQAKRNVILGRPMMYELKHGVYNNIHAMTDNLIMLQKGKPEPKAWVKSKSITLVFC